MCVAGKHPKHPNRNRSRACEFSRVVPLLYARPYSSDDCCSNFFFRDLHENNLDVASIVTTAATGSAMAAMVKANEPPTVEGQQQLDQQLSNEPCPSTSTGKGGQQQPGTPQIVVGTIELNNLNGDVANHKVRSDCTSLFKWIFFLNES